jgi:PPP family 3-phenylpropionic acid transporter
VTRPTSIRRLQCHYFAIYTVFGAITPYLPIYLRDVKGLGASQMGIIFAAGQSAVLVMPILMTYLADRYRLVRPILMALFCCNLVAMVFLLGAVGFWASLCCIALNRLATQPQVALGDGLFFTLQNDPTQPRASFSSVRVWGTIGFIIPSLIMYAGYHLGGGVTWMPYVTAAFALFGIINAFGLPQRSAPRPSTPQSMPTLAAARVLRRPPLALFCLGVGFVIFSNMAFYGFYPLYLTAQVGIAERWVGLISSLGVGFEIIYVLALEPMRKRFGFGGLIILGGAASVFRLACLAFLPTPFFAIIFQVFHGLTVIAFMIVPVIYLNTFAEEGFRNSIQGLYVMLVSGLFAIAGNIAAGQLAEISLVTLYQVSLVVCLFGLALIGISFWLRRQNPPNAPIAQAPALPFTSDSLSLNK